MSTFLFELNPTVSRRGEVQLWSFGRSGRLRESWDRILFSIFLHQISDWTRHYPLGVEQNRNRNFEQKPKLVSVQSGYRNYRHTGYNFQEESRKNIFFLYIHSKSERWKWKQKNILPAFFLKVVAGMPVIPVSWLNRNQFWFLLKVSVSVLFNP